MVWRLQIYAFVVLTTIKRFFSKRFLIRAGALGAVALLGIAVLALLVAIRRMPTPLQIEASYRSKDRAILDRNGEVIDEIRLGEQKERRLNWVPIERMSPDFLDAVLAAQDRYFFYHPGVALQPERPTITMQVAARITRGRLPLAARAVALEMAWKKREILEAYVNLMIYRGGLQGIGAASRSLFDKSPQALTRAEGAVLAALIGRPEASIPTVRAWACELLGRLGAPEECGSISRGHLAYLEESYRIRPFISLAPFVAQRLAKVGSGSLVTSTLDRQIQWLALNALQTSSDDGRAVVVLENATGHVLAYVSASRAVDEVAQPRPAGSALLPMLYAKALDERVLTLATRLADMPSARRALHKKSSLAALKALDQLGIENYVQSLQALGFAGLASPDSYGPSLALGQIDLSLLELTNAYRTLANDGKWSPLRFSKQEVSELAPHKVYSAQTAFLMKQALQEGASPWRVLQVSPQISIGFSERYTVGVVGSRALWRKVMDGLRDQESSAPPVPKGLVQVDSEWFLEGTEPALEVVADQSAAKSYISYPQNLSTLDWGDPRFSRENPRLFIQVARPQADQNLYLNGRRLGRASALLPWEPQSGRFLLELRDSRGHVVHRVRFEVQGRRFAMSTSG